MEKTPQELLWRQETMYQDRADIWRLVGNDANQESEGQKVPKRVGVDLWCHFFHKQPEVAAPVGGGRSSVAGQGAQHLYRSAAGDDVRDGDFVVNVRMNPYDETKPGVLYGRVYKVQGDPEIVVGSHGRVNTLTAVLVREQGVSDWIARQYVTPETR